MEYELRRLQRALENVEERQRWDRINRQENPALEQERRRVESRLRELLDDHQVGAARYPPSGWHMNPNARLQEDRGGDAAQF
jgi:hypothetical protein